MTGAERFNELLNRDGTNPRDLERQSFFYILAYANQGDLYKKVDHIYDFKDHSIKPEVIAYTEYQLEENRAMGEPWMNRCAMCELPLDEGETHKCTYCNNLPDLCSSSKKLVQLAFNLYNLYDCRADVADTLCVLDDENFEIAMKAIRIRFNKA